MYVVNGKYMNELKIQRNLSIFFFCLHFFLPSFLQNTYFINLALPDGQNSHTFWDLLLISFEVCLLREYLKNELMIIIMMKILL